MHKTIPSIIIINQLLNDFKNDIKNNNIGLDKIKVKPIENAVFSGIALIFLNIIFTQHYSNSNTKLCVSVYQNLTLTWYRLFKI